MPNSKIPLKTAEIDKTAYWISSLQSNLSICSRKDNCLKKNQESKKKL